MFINQIICHKKDAVDGRRRNKSGGGCEGWGTYHTVNYGVGRECKRKWRWPWLW